MPFPESQIQREVLRGKPQKVIDQASRALKHSMEQVIEDAVPQDPDEPDTPAWTKGLLTSTEGICAVRDRIIGGSKEGDPVRTCPYLGLQVNAATITFVRHLAAWFVDPKGRQMMAIRGGGFDSGCASIRANPFATRKPKALEAGEKRDGRKTRRDRPNLACEGPTEAEF